MCRFLANLGEPILLEELIASPSHSLIKQSQHAAEGKTETNGDGFGVGWYGERSEPGLYRYPVFADSQILRGSAHCLSMSWTEKSSLHQVAWATGMVVILGGG
jgi:predicted glutamine amidotransferase